MSQIHNDDHRPSSSDVAHPDADALGEPVMGFRGHEGRFDPSHVRRGEVVLRARLRARVLRRTRYVVATLAEPRLAGPPMALGRRTRLEIGSRGSLRRGTGLVLGDGFSALIDGPLVIGSGVFFNRDANLSVYAGLTIGDGCRFGERLSIHDEDHAPRSDDQQETTQPDPSTEYLATPVTIGAHVWVGANVTILRGARIGDGAVIAAGAVVRGPIPAGALAAGVPARVIRDTEARS